MSLSCTPDGPGRPPTIARRSRCPPIRTGPADRCTRKWWNDESTPTPKRCGGFSNRSAPSTACRRRRRRGPCVVGSADGPAPPDADRHRLSRTSCIPETSWTGGGSSRWTARTCCGCARMFRCRAGCGSSCRYAMTADGGSYYRQRALFQPYGLAGEAWWIASTPFRSAIFGGIARDITSRAHGAVAATRA